MNKSTTYYDLNETSSAAAKTSLGKDALSIDSIKLEAFGAAGHDRLDYPIWDGMFISHRQNYITLMQRETPATLAAKAEAAKAVKATPTPAPAQ